MYKLLPSYLVWGIVGLSLAAVALPYFHLNSAIVNALTLMVLVGALLTKKKYAITIFSSAVVLTFFCVSYSEENLETGRFIIASAYPAVWLAIALVLGLHIKKMIYSVRSEKAQMASLFENANEGILLANEKGNIILANPALSSMFGYEQGELLGKEIEILMPGRFKHDHIRIRDKYIAAPRNRTMCAGRDVLGKRKDGTEFPAEISLSFYKDNKETVVIAFVIDITRRKEIESRIIQQSAELEKKVEDRTLVLKEALNKLEESQKDLQESLEKQRELNDIKSKFVSMASHEFRTPLSTVLSSAELISKYTAIVDQAKRDKHINRIKNSVHHLNDILEDFLSVGKLEEGRVCSQQARFNLKQLVEKVKSEMGNSKKEGQKIYIEYEGQEMIELDKKLLNNILINLLSNAIKYSGPFKPIIISVEASQEVVVVAVKDEGIGIPEDDQQHLFNTFFRGANASTIQGTGLGLHIVKRYVDLMKGSISLQSKLNEGTTVSIRFPLNTHQILPNEKEYSYN